MPSSVGKGPRVPAIGIALAIAASFAQADQGQAIDPSGPTIKLDDVGIYSVGCRYRNGTEKQFPIGWSGNFDDATGVACMPFGEQHGKMAALLHCPWRGGTGISYQEFRFRVPRVSRAVVSGAIALGTYAVGKSDGATFRLFVNGQKLLEKNRKTDDWKEFSFDITRFTGGILTLRFETDPGPLDNPSFDYSLWGDRTLELRGLPAQKPAQNPAASPNLLAASSVGASDVAPLDGEKGVPALLTQGATRVFRWTGATGRMEYRWRFPSGDADAPLGSVILTSSPASNGAAHTEATPLAASASIVWTDEAHPGQARPISIPGGSDSSKPTSWGLRRRPCA